MDEGVLMFEEVGGGGFLEEVDVWVEIKYMKRRRVGERGGVVWFLGGFEVVGIGFFGGVEG